ncbi:DHA2 family efflux MFS transporter permease subunit [Mycolicibacterium komossense]|uniref:DHA2 family efflux MFS transporter permease subunit n=2 Tax=Mycolicibacterium komossense TaxID=1779 RepID=A0ABT3CK51_9MYCO|nr:DHA2 family efflux MFS transporter permease subunit [Mycolicibacterium komossense]
MTGPRRKPAQAAPRNQVKKSGSGPPARKPEPKPATRTARKPPVADSGGATPVNPWNALWAMLVGFFMILVDSTIVSVANPTIMVKLQTDYDAIIWVTSAYLLAYAVPLLVAGRLGDRYGPKNLYIVGLAVFTLASLWCGLSGSIETLIAARVVQGIGAALLTPQTLSTITRIFPPERRGVAMSVWGATAGVATLVGPLAGGVLVDHLGWQWIFFVNVPIGVIGLGLAVWLIPVLPTNKHHFDWLGVVLSGIAMFLVVFGLQEGQSHGWALWIWALIVGGVVVMAGFVYWQAVNKREPLIPLRIFRDRNFTLANIGTAVIGFAIVALIVPLMFYAQAVCGLTPTQSALLTAPMAIASGVPAPFVGKLVDRAHPRPIIGFGFSILAIALTWLSIEMTPTTPIWRLVLPLAATGLGMAFIFAPLAATATRHLPSQLAGAGSGVFNATRQVGSVLGSAGMAAFMTSRISAEMPGGQSRPSGEGSIEQLPPFLHQPFSAALSQSMLLPAFIALFGIIAALFLLGFDKKPVKVTPARAVNRSALTRFDDDSTEIIPIVRDEMSTDSPFWRSDGERPAEEFVDGHVEDVDYGSGYDYDDDYDDDGYVEFAIVGESGPESVLDVEVVDDPEPDMPFGDGDTAPLPTRAEHPRPAPAEAWHSAPVEAWHSLLDDDDNATGAGQRPPVVEPIGFAHNGFHVDEPEALRPVPDPAPDAAVDGFARLANSIDTWSDSFADLFERQREYGGGEFRSEARAPRHELPDAPSPEAGRRARHYREDPDDAPSGRHSSSGHD